MKEESNNKPADNKQPDKETEASISSGKKAIEVQKKTAGKPGKEEEEQKTDAEKWRNEG